MKYQILVLDLDGTLTNSNKQITEPTRAALLEIQEQGKKVVLASGRPTQGVAPLAESLRLSDYGSYILSFNGARIIDCRSGALIYSKTLPLEITAPLYDICRNYTVDMVSYDTAELISAFTPNRYTESESRINHMPIRRTENFCEYVSGYPNNKFLVTGEPDEIARVQKELTNKFRGLLNIYCSEPYFLEIMPQKIDKAFSLQRLLNSIGLTSDEMICCGDGYNDVTMIESAGLGVAMQNAQPLVLEKADFITKSNDEDGVLHVINEFMRD